MHLPTLLPTFLGLSSLVTTAFSQATSTSTSTFKARIRNHCGNTMRVFIDGVDNGPLHSGFDLYRYLGLDTQVYTTFNGGSASGAGTTRAVFWFEKFYYYIVKEPVTNVGVMISANHPISPDGLCQQIDCEPQFCAGRAFGERQTALNNPAFVADATPVTAAPDEPLRSCPFGSTDYTIEFCPNGTPPGWEQNGQEIQLVMPGDRIWCADVRAASFVPGTPVQLYKCNGTPAQKWIVPSPAKSAGQVRVAGRDLCLDAGRNAQNGRRLTIQQCVANRDSQTWVYDNTNGRYTFSLASRAQCLDNTDGRITDSNPLQVWGCSRENANQKWLVSVEFAP